MSAADNSSAIIDLERTILRVLCSGHFTSLTNSSPEDGSRNSAVSTLFSHRWRDAEHRIVFEALARLPGRDGAELQRQLPAQATRMGFPDVSWETYFGIDMPHRKRTPDELRRELATLVTQLRAAASETAP